MYDIIKIKIHTFRNLNLSIFRTPQCMSLKITHPNRDSKQISKEGRKRSAA